MHELESDLFIEKAVVRAIDGAHSSFTQGFFDGIAIRNAVAMGEGDGCLMLADGVGRNDDRSAAGETNTPPPLYCGRYADGKATVAAGNLNHNVD